MAISFFVFDFFLASKDIRSKALLLSPLVTCVYDLSVA